MIVAKTGNEVMAYAMKQVNPDVVAAYPITPSTEIVQIFSSYVADGLVDTEYVAVESEHSAMSACIGASAAGARVMTATASQGMALMHEMLFIAGGLRLPIVLCLASRSISAPLNIHCDHSDSFASRDSGWIQLFCESSQEGYDTTVQAIRIAETTSIPVMVAIDGFILSHCMDRIELLEDKQVQDFVGKFKPSVSLLDVEHPFLLSPACFTDSFFEHKRAQADAMNHSLATIEAVADDYGKRFGRHWPTIEGYRTEDAEAVILSMGSSVGTVRVAVDELRERGKKVGAVKLRVFRPLAHERLRAELAGFPVVGVLDRADSIDAYVSPLANEIRSALYSLPRRPLMPSYVYGLGGRDFDVDDATRIFKELLAAKAAGRAREEVTYIGVRGDTPQEVK